MSAFQVSTDGMNPRTGVFTVRRAGVYRITFTGLYNSLKGHQVNTDIIRKSAQSLRFLGRSSAQTTETGGVFGKSDEALKDPPSDETLYT